MTAMMFWILLFIIITLIKADSIKLQCPPQTASIKSFLDNAHIPGASIVVLNRNEILYEEGIGYQSPPIFEQRQKMNSSSSIFVLASISKTFIAVAAMQMVELNLLNLDEDINKYLSPRMIIVHPSFPNVTITTRHLLTHRAAIGQNLVEEYKFYLPGDGFTQTNLSDILRNYLSYNASWLPIPPGGNITFYSNVGASLVALIVERLANMSFEEYVQEKILKVLGIDKTNGGYRLSNFQNKTECLVGHYIYNASWLQYFQSLVPQLNIIRINNTSDWLYVPFYGVSRYPAGYLRMSSRSLSRFLQSFLNNFTNLLHNSSSIEQILHISSQESFKNTTSNQFGLLWYWKVIEGRRFLGHEGSVPGITTLMMANEKRNLGVIILMNGDVVRNDNQGKQVQQTINNIAMKLFDCFDKLSNTASTHQSISFFLYALHIVIICFLQHILNSKS